MGMAGAYDPPKSMFLKLDKARNFNNRSNILKYNNLKEQLKH